MRIRKPSALHVFVTFFLLGLTSFGGPVAHIGYFRKKLVEEKQWLDDKKFSELFAMCQFLPGPTSSQLGFAIGLLSSGWLGALCAFIGFTLPSFLLLILFANTFTDLTNNVGISAVHGLKLVACVVVADALVNMYRQLCPTYRTRALALFALFSSVLITSLYGNVLIILLGGTLGLVLLPNSAENIEAKDNLFYGRKHALFALFTFLLLLCASYLLTNVNSELFVFASFYKAGALVFGGGHVVLPLLEELTVNSGLIAKSDFLAGYGAAQAIPGPMFTFAAYQGWIIGSESSPILMSILATFAIFLPGFLLIIAILPFWQCISQYSAIKRAIAGINAAVVGILAAALYDPVIVSGITTILDLAIFVLGFVSLYFYKKSPLLVVLFCVAISMLMSAINTV